MTHGISKHDLVAIPVAARIVFQRAYGRSPPKTHLADRLNGLAYCLASLGRLYAIERRKAAPRPLSREELQCGYFRNGGRELHFLDERAPVLHIGVTEASIEGAVSALRRNQAALR